MYTCMYMYTCIHEYMYMYMYVLMSVCIVCVFVCTCMCRLLQLVVRSDLNQTMVHMQKAIAVDISCVQAYDTIASIEMQR